MYTKNVEPKNVQPGLLRTPRAALKNTDLIKNNKNGYVLRTLPLPACKNSKNSF